MPRILRRTAVVAVLVSLLPIACSSDGPTATTTVETTTFAAALGVNLAASTRTASGLYYRDLVTGTGAAAALGNQLTVHYTGWLANGTQFDANLAGATPFAFTLGVGDVIPGWDQGLAGMRPGGRRQLIIPPGLAYGGQARDKIPANSILVFNVDLLTAR